jgi:osomolarity two-component system, sensor histidine kinase SLN1
MRIGIREQLAAVVLVTALVPLAVLATATWVNSQKFVTQVTSNSLSLTASLKSSQIASDLLLIQSTCSTFSSRVVLQDTLKSFYQQNGAGQNWTLASDDISQALESGGLSALVQVTIFSRNSTGNPYGLLNVTANQTDITLPSQYPDGAPVMLGDNGPGYPAALYPSLTYNTTSTPDPLDPGTNETLVSAFGNFSLNSTSQLLLGPLQTNESFAMISLTLPILDNSNPSNVLGFMTVVAAATFLIEVIQSRAGLADTGTVLLVGPDQPTNLFPSADRPATEDYHPRAKTIGSALVRYVFPPDPAPGQEDKHSVYNANLAKYGTSNFTEDQFPAVVDGFSDLVASINNASTLLTTTNENNATVSVGYARPDSNLVDWLLIVEQSHSEAWAPIYQLRNIVLACVFGAIGLVLIFVVPFAHYSVRPIRRLREATKKSIAPPRSSPNGSDSSDRDEPGENGEADEENGLSRRSKKGFVVRLKRLTPTRRRKSQAERDEEKRRRGFRIPAKVQDRKHLIHDELSDLTGNYSLLECYVC